MPEEDAPQNSERLLEILRAYGQAIVPKANERTKIDPHVTRILLESLQSLNDRWKLFSRDLFKTNLLSAFMNALINAIMAPEGILHQDLLISIIFTMGRVDVSELHASFVSVGYSANSKAVQEVCLAVVSEDGEDT